MLQSKTLLVGFLISLVAAAGCADQDAAPAATTETRTVALGETVASPDSLTGRLFKETMAYARRNNLHELPIGEIMTTVGERFLDAPYEGGMLDEPAKETLICRLDAFDCVTFVESTLAMARAIKLRDYRHETWTSYIRDQRYRGGRMGDYCSRLHYFTEWIRDNEARGTVEDLTEELGGLSLEKQLNFMTDHRGSYPRFAENDSLFQCIKEMEASLEGQELYYIPQDQIRTIYDRLRAGDILAFATNIEGLDVAHTGLVYESGDGTIGALHASSSSDRVKVSPDLQSYVEGVDNHIGIIVARPHAP